MRVAITTPHLNRDGGVPRITCLLANALVAEGHDVAVITRFHSTFDEQPLSEAVERSQAFVPRGPKALRNVQLPLVVASLRQHLSKFRPDIVIGCRWDCAILSLLATRRSRVATIAWEQGHLPLARLSAAWRTLRRRTYPRAAAIVVINHSSVDFARRFVDGARVHVIPNYMSDAGPTSPGTDTSAWLDFPGGPPRHKVLGVGRLEPEKGFDLLVEAYARLKSDFSDWAVLIVGRGSERDRLEELIAIHGLEGRVQLGGPVTDPTATYRDSDVFVLPSRMEGYGVALVEAMAEGLVAVAFDCPAGPRDIITNDVDGILVPDGDVVALSDALRRVMSDPDLRARLSTESPAVAQQLSRANVMRMWTAVLRSAAGNQTTVPV